MICMIERKLTLSSSMVSLATQLLIARRRSRNYFFDLYLSHETRLEANLNSDELK